MNVDIRLSVGFWQHPKTKKTAKRLGLEGVRSLQILWLWAAVNRPDGNLAGMDWEDIELAADWMGEDSKFFDACLGLWIDETEEGYTLHDWQDHNAWASDADARGDAARLSRLARKNPEAAAGLRADGIRGITADEYRTYAEGTPYMRRTYAEGTPYNERSTDRTTPSPTLRKEEKEEDLKPTSFTENEDQARDTRWAQVGVVEESDALERGTVPERQENGGLGTIREVTAGTDVPSIEFEELRAWYSEHCRPEGPLAGFVEFKQAVAARKWPGQARIYDDLEARSASDKWQRGFAPSLATYLRTRGWDAPPEAATRASPDERRTGSVRDAEILERDQRARRLLARRAQEGKNARPERHAGIADDNVSALPAGAIH